MSFDLNTTPNRRRMSLTPMIDVVFLLLVFFMLASRFDAPQAVDIALAAGGSNYQGAPRLVDIGPDSLRLNGVIVAERELAAELLKLMSAPDDVVVLRGRNGATVQRSVDVLMMLRSEGITSLTVVE